jgi:hypothetical protein
MRQLTEKQIINQNSLFELHKNVCFHADRVLSNLSEKSILHLKDFSQRTCRLLCQFISDDANIFDILNDPEIITILDSFYKELANNKSITTVNSSRRAMNFILYEVWGYYKTKHWLPLHSKKFDEKLNVLDRFLLCIEAAKEIIFLSYPNIRTDRAYKYFMAQINDICGGNYVTSFSLRMNFYRKKMPIWVNDNIDIKPDFYLGKEHKPICIAKAIEKLSGAPKGYLIDLINISEIKKEKLSRIGVRADSFDILLINSTFRKELKLYAEYKTSAIINKKRNEKWTVRLQNNKTKQKYKTIMNATLIKELCVLNPEQSIPSFEVLIGHIIRISRYALDLKLLKADELSLYTVTQAEISEKILNHLINKDQFIPSHMYNYLSSFAALWFSNSPFFVEFADEVFSTRYNLSKDQLLQVSKDNQDRFKKLQSQVKSYVKQSKNSHKLLNRNVLELENPSMYILDILKNAKLDLNSVLDSKELSSHSATLIRNICIVSCLLCCPLRVRNWVNMKIGYHQDDECIYFDDNKKSYVLSIPKSQFKNFKQKNIPDVFSLVILPQFTQAITDYINEARPLLLKGEQSDYFLVSQHSSKIDTGSLNRMIKQFTYQYDDKNLRIGGINIHAFRAIVATTFLKKFKGSFAYAAFLLLDSEETIRESYGHLSPYDAFAEWGKIISVEAE